MQQSKDLSPLVQLKVLAEYQQGVHFVGAQPFQAQRSNVDRISVYRIAHDAQSFQITLAYWTQLDLRNALHLTV